tara:strand:- start:1 stop:291 length:291 start_codon:yes stop_codon:yes gene_type:complete
MLTSKKLQDTLSQPTKQKFGCWQVSMVENCERKYYHFSYLGSALSFVNDSFKKYMGDTGYYPVGSANVSHRVFTNGAKPRRLDGKPFKGWESIHYL